MAWDSLRFKAPHALVFSLFLPLPLTITVFDPRGAFSACPTLLQGVGQGGKAPTPIEVSNYLFLSQC